MEIHSNIFCLEKGKEKKEKRNKRETKAEKIYYRFFWGGKGGDFKKESRKDGDIDR